MCQSHSFILHVSSYIKRNLNALYGCSHFMLSLCLIVIDLNGTVFKYILCYNPIFKYQDGSLPLNSYAKKKVPHFVGCDVYRTKNS